MDENPRRHQPLAIAVAHMRLLQLQPAFLVRFRFPGSSKAFGTAAQLTSSMQKFLSGYSSLLPDAAALIIAFALSSWFTDCFAVAPTLYLLGPENEASLLLRLVGCLCRRPILLSEVDIAALGTLPRDLNATLLVNQHGLGRRVTRVLLAGKCALKLEVAKTGNYMLAGKYPEATQLAPGRLGHSRIMGRTDRVRTGG